MNSQRPLSRKKTLQLFLLLTILAWATQTLFHQWGYGQEVAPNTAMRASASSPPLSSDPSLAGQEKFVPSALPRAGVLEIKTDATVVGADVKLKQICRWSDRDADLFAPIADLTVARITGLSPFRTVSLEDVRQMLHDAGVNLGTIHFAGATRCTVTRGDLPMDEHQALQAWLDSQQAPGTATDATPAAAAIAPPSSQPASILATPNESNPPSSVHSLREVLTNDLCQRLGISTDVVQMAFDAEDEKVLGLVEPYFKFDVRPSRVRDLGRVSWDVTIIGNTSSRNVSVNAMARAWEHELIVARPLAVKQVLREEDFTQRRILADSLPTDPLLTIEQCVGQQASRDLKPGTVMSARLVDPIPLIHAGQIVTIILVRGTVQIRAVARAMEQGTLGQVIKVRNETTREIFDVTVLGPQEARLGPQDANANPPAVRN